jgi:uncharacterized protein (DUF2252 family)
VPAARISARQEPAMTEAATAATPASTDDRTPEARARRGKEARARRPRSDHGDWESATKRPDPVDILLEQAKTRVPDLVPIRHGRMAASAFAFYRGAAAVMASDLASAAHSGLDVQLCGDAHLSNFGGFGSPERSLVFDVNDFDETLPGPFEWDLKRLAASLEIAARGRGFDDKVRAQVVSGSIQRYRETIRGFGGMGRLDVWYQHLDQQKLLSLMGQDVAGAVLKRFQRTVDKAESKDRLKAKAKLTRVVDGELCFSSDPPLLVPARELFPEREHDELFANIGSLMDEYRDSLNDDRRHLLEQYRFVDLARKVVGVGSVGTRSWVALMVGRDDNDPLFLQVKEAEASVLEPYLGGSEFDNHGERVVQGQRLMQTASDIFLGWERIEVGVDGRPHDYYMRQLWDWKASADVDTMDPRTLEIYGQMCGWVLARSHARSGDPISIGAYLGSGTTFDQAMVRFSASYADQNERDHQHVVDAIASGALEAQSGI